MVSVAPVGQGSGGSAPRGWDPALIAPDFPMLLRQVRGTRLAYLDNAATALKPTAVIDAVTSYYRDFSANVARGVHTVSQQATDRFESVRDQVAQFIGAGRPDEVVFTAGTTAAINLVASSYGGQVLRAGDEILVTEMEHHSNLVPWHLVASRAGAVVRPIPMSNTGEVDLDGLQAMLSPKVKVIAITHASNVLGTLVPLEQITRLAREVGAVTVVDGAQAVPHVSVDVRALGCDFYAFSGHKLFGPTGIGVLWGRRDLLTAMPPLFGGGGMIGSVDVDHSTYALPPARFEAGTPPIAEVFGLGAALDYVGEWDRSAALQYEDQLLAEAIERLDQIEGVTVFSRAKSKVSVLAFSVNGVHPHDVGTALDSLGVAVRAGHHCAQPLMHRLGVVGTVRASFAPYNTRADIDLLVEGVRQAKSVFGQ